MKNHKKKTLIVALGTAALGIGIATTTIAQACSSSQGIARQQIARNAVGEIFNYDITNNNTELSRSARGLINALEERGQSLFSDAVINTISFSNANNDVDVDSSGTTIIIRGTVSIVFDGNIVLTNNTAQINNTGFFFGNIRYNDNNDIVSSTANDLFSPPELYLNNSVFQTVNNNTSSILSSDGITAFVGLFNNSPATNNSSETPDRINVSSENLGNFFSSTSLEYRVNNLILNSTDNTYNFTLDITTFTTSIHETGAVSYSDENLSNIPYSWNIINFNPSSPAIASINFAANQPIGITLTLQTLLTTAIDNFYLIGNVIEFDRIIGLIRANGNDLNVSTPEIPNFNSEFISGTTNSINIDTISSTVDSNGDQSTDFNVTLSITDLAFRFLASGATEDVFVPSENISREPIVTGVAVLPLILQFSIDINNAFAVPTSGVTGETFILIG